MTNVRQAASAGGARTMPKCLVRHRELINDALRAAVDRLPPAVRAVAGYHFGWRDADGE